MKHRLCLAAAALLAMAITVRATGTSAAAQPAAHRSGAGPRATGETRGGSGAARRGRAVRRHRHLRHLPRRRRQAIKAPSTAQAKNPRTPAATHGCESCHGPGQAHVDDDAKGHILKSAQMKPADINETCLTCHNRGKHAGWEGSAHEARNLSCTTCHSVHNPQSFEHQLVKATETQLCATCHRAAGGQDRTRRGAHAGARRQDVVLVVPQPARIDQQREGAQGRQLGQRDCARAATPRCADRCCGSTRRCARTARPATIRMARRTIACWSSACRCSASAATSPRDIRRRSTTTTSITTNKSNRMFGRSCVNCHSNIHGSNHPSGQFFMR